MPAVCKPSQRLRANIYGIFADFTPFNARKSSLARVLSRIGQRKDLRASGEGMVTAQILQQLKHTVVLVGMMGAGKTAVGTAVARSLAVPFVDSDEEIIRAAQMSVAEIFARDGEPFFRARESEVLQRLMTGAPCVLSTGGGAFLAPQNRAVIAAHGVSVWLKADLELLWNRVRHKTTRPLLRTADPKATLRGLLEARAPVYALADVKVEAEPDLSVEAMAAKVIDALRAHGDLVE